MRRITLLILLITTTTIQAQEKNIIPIEISEYGLLFTEVVVNGEKVKAMIDFGDPHVIMLSGSLVKKQKLKTTTSDRVGYNMNGEELKFFEGSAEQVEVNGLKLSDVDFTSSPGEMEGVSEQIGTRFDAALGWGFFSRYTFTLDYSKAQILLEKGAQVRSGEGFVMDYDKSGNYMTLKADFGEKQGNLIIDTGSPVTYLHSKFLDQPATGKNEYGQDYQQIETLFGETRLTLNYEMRDLSILANINAVGIIGGDILKKYQITVDPAKQTMYWVPAKT